MNLKLPWHHRLYFWLRKWAMRFLCVLIRLSVRINSPWLYFHLMELQRGMGWRFER